jgi:inorganic pyrophosphatase
MFWFWLIWLPCSTGVPYRAVVGGAPVSPRAFAIDGETVVGPIHFSRGSPATNDDGSVNAVIEIPAGTTGKFEVDDDDGALHWRRDRDTGERRVVDYLAFLVNYGMVPRTLADDGDALDIVVLGGVIARGHVARTRVIGVLKMGDDRERDDKLIAVPVEPALENGFSRLHELDELDEHYPESRTILVLWFTNYWGAGATNVLGWGDRDEALAILERAKLTAAARPMPPAQQILVLERARHPSSTFVDRVGALGCGDAAQHVQRHHAHANEPAIPCLVGGALRELHRGLSIAEFVRTVRETDALAERDERHRRVGDRLVQLARACDVRLVSRKLAQHRAMQRALVEHPRAIDQRVDLWQLGASERRLDLLPPRRRCRAVARVGLELRAQ